MKKNGFILIFLFCCAFVSATQNYYFVTLHDKANSSYSLSQPETFFSERAIARRIKHNCPVDSMDLPLNSNYVDSIKSFGITVHHRSKWFNGLTIIATTEQIQAIQSLDFVDSVELTWAPKNPIRRIQKNVAATTTLNYGASQVQTEMLHVPFLHTAGFLGDGLHIAVMDVGFFNVDTITAFDSLRLQGRLLGSRDFVNPQGSVFDQGTHGTAVLSTMAANIPETYLGTAPKASYWLFRTEDEVPESRLEIDNWVAALEFADSLGVDIVNSSLGYTEFDDPTQNFTYADINGRTARNSLAATFAARRGMLIFTSAGNEGAKTWRYISTPADADSVFTVGSVTDAQLFSGFSSVGPTFDGRIKPEVCAMGSAAAVVTSGNVITYSNGTSFSSPIMAGSVACLWQAFPSKTNMEILNLVLASSDRYTSPDNQYGFGIPDLWSIYTSIVSKENLVKSGIKPICYPNPVATWLTIEAGNLPIYWVLCDMQGCLKQIGTTSQIDFSHVSIGFYFLKITQGTDCFVHKIIKY